MNYAKYEDLPDVLTVPEMAKYLRVGINNAYQLGKEIPHYTAGNKKLFPKELVRDWMLSRK